MYPQTRRYQPGVVTCQRVVRVEPIIIEGSLGVLTPMESVGTSVSVVCHVSDVACERYHWNRSSDLSSGEDTRRHNKSSALKISRVGYSTSILHSRTVSLVVCVCVPYWLSWSVSVMNQTSARDRTTHVVTIHFILVDTWPSHDVFNRCELLSSRAVDPHHLVAESS